MTLNTKQDYLKRIDFHYLLVFSSKTKIYRNYIKYFTKKDFVNALLRALTKEQCIILYNAFMNGISPEKMAKSFMSKNPTCDIIRSKLVDHLNVKDEVIFFEFPILNTRTDVTRVNGRSYNYEIKTGRDKIERLEKQMSTFTTVFERNSVVCPEESLDTVVEHVPYVVGVITYELLDNGICFRERILPRKSGNLSSENQLDVLTIEGLKNIYERRIGKMKNQTRVKLIEKISSRLTNNEINEEFKQYLKKKHAPHQNRLVSGYT